MEHFDTKSVLKMAHLQYLLWCKYTLFRHFLIKLLSLSQILKKCYHTKISQTLVHIVLYPDAKFCAAQTLQTGSSMVKDPEMSF